MFAWIIGSSLKFRFIVLALAGVMLGVGLYQLPRMPVDVFPEEWDLDTLLVTLAEIYPVTSTKADIEAVRDVPEMQARFMEEAVAAYDAKETAMTSPVMGLRKMQRTASPP